MDFKIPEPLKVEHEELHAELVALTKSSGKVGEAARNVATLLHPHFVKGGRVRAPAVGAPRHDRATGCDAEDAGGAVSDRAAEEGPAADARGA